MFLSRTGEGVVKKISTDGGGFFFVGEMNFCFMSLHKVTKR